MPLGLISGLLLYRLSYEKAQTSIRAIFIWPWNMVSVSVRFLFYRPIDKKIKTWSLRFPAKENPNMENALFDRPIVLQYDVKVKFQLISRKFSGVTFCHPERSLVRAFSFQGHTKIALSLLIVLAPIGTHWEDKQTAKINPDIFV